MLNLNYEEQNKKDDLGDELLVKVGIKQMISNVIEISTIVVLTVLAKVEVISNVFERIIINDRFLISID